jgi:hypothetical protein
MVVPLATNLNYAHIVSIYIMFFRVHRTIHGRAWPAG